MKKTICFFCKTIVAIQRKSIEKHYFLIQGNNVFYYVNNLKLTRRRGPYRYHNGWIGKNIWLLHT